jgi:hypothetical protein
MTRVAPPDPPAPDPNWAEALTAWTTLGGVIGAAIAAFAAIATLRQATGQRRRQQASLVHAYFETEYKRVDLPDGLTSHRIEHRGYVLNASGAPVFDVELDFTDQLLHDGWGKARTVPLILPKTEPQTQVAFSNPATSVGKPGVPEVEAKGLLITFTDGEGNRWRRDEHGTLLIVTRAPMTLTSRRALAWLRKTEPTTPSPPPRM